jgi:hypothetical protein
MRTIRLEILLHLPEKWLHDRFAARKLLKYCRNFLIDFLGSGIDPKNPGEALKFTCSNSKCYIIEQCPYMHVQCCEKFEDFLAEQILKGYDMKNIFSNIPGLAKQSRWSSLAKGGSKAAGWGLRPNFS